MWHQQIFVCVIYMLLRQVKTDGESRFNGVTSDLLASQQQQQQEELNQEQQEQQLQVNLKAWQPLTGHNNWLILQATAATSMQRQQEQQHRLPVNYYAYNHRYNPRSSSSNIAVAKNGNYKQVRPNLNDSPSYVLAISQTMPLEGARVAEGRRESELDRVEMRPQLPPSGLKNVQEVDMRVESDVRNVNDIMSLNNAVDDVADDVENQSASNLSIENYFAPFRQVVLKVRNFCDTLRSLMSDEESGVEAEDMVQGEQKQHQPQQQQETQQQNQQQQQQQQLLPDASSISSRLDAKARAMISVTSKETQGRYSRLASTYQSRKLKKLKKKIQKLLLPLLFAYKLKFLTLIPVLIGGLTLLVGTTGLAGFFFALFTAVMSLKTSTGGGHGSKAIILKKI